MLSAFGIILALRNLPVYLLDQNTQTKTLLPTSDAFDALSDSWWGNEAKYQGRKIAICHEHIF